MTTAGIESAPVTVTGPVGGIEAAVDRVAGLPARFVCVVCHPHPLHQGTMQNKVVTTLARTAARCGGISLRFNYRGVGASQGSYDGERGELDDALAAISHLRSTVDTPLPLVVAGFSFGGAIAYRAALETESLALITVSPAHERIPAEIIGNFANWLLVQGDADEIIPSEGVLNWAAQHDPAPELAQLSNAGHFYHGRLNELADSVAAFVEDRCLKR